MDSMHLIHIPDLESRKKAMMALLDVNEQYVCMPDNLFGISGKQLEALRKAQVVFEDASRSTQNDQTK